jgi:CRP-like cAMP-binding protein
MLADLYAKKTGRQAVPIATPAPVAKPLPVALEQELNVEEEKVLPSIPLFSDLPKNAFIQLMEQMTMRRVLPGEVIIRQGDVDDSMYIVSSGKVKVTKASDQGTEILLAYLSDGAFFGEMALLSESPRTASVAAEEETTLFAVSRAVLDEVTRNFPSVKNILLKFYRQRLLNNLIATSPIFKPLSGEQRKVLIEQFKSREVAAQEKLIEQGEKSDGLYLLLTGAVEVAAVIDGKRKVLAHLKEGDVFGEMSLINDINATATVKALRKSIVLKLPKKTFTETVQTHPQLLEHIRNLSREREKTTQAIAAGKIAFSEEGLVVV